MFTAEQILATQKTNIDTLFGLTNKAFVGIEQLVTLNVTAAKAALADAAVTTQALLSATNPQDFVAVQAGLAQPIADKATAYATHVRAIVTDASAEFGAAIEAKTAEAQKAIVGFADSAAKNAPAGSETAVAMMKSAVAAANNAYESVQKAVKQATDVAEANLAAVTNTAVSAAKSASKKR